MQGYKLKVPDSGFPEGTILYGPLPIQGSSFPGYYPENELHTVPGTQCFFESAVTGHPEIFEPLGEVVDPRTKNKQ